MARYCKPLHAIASDRKATVQPKLMRAITSCRTLSPTLASCAKVVRVAGLLQATASYCKVLQDVASYCRLSQAIVSLAKHRELLQPIANLAFIASHAKLLQAIASQCQTNGNLMQDVPSCCPMSQGIASDHKLLLTSRKLAQAIVPHSAKSFP